jgi:hypothetical protein
MNKIIRIEHDTKYCIMKCDDNSFLSVNNSTFFTNINQTYKDHVLVKKLFPYEYTSMSIFSLLFQSKKVCSLNLKILKEFEKKQGVVNKLKIVKISIEKKYSIYENNKINNI